MSSMPVQAGGDGHCSVGVTSPQQPDGAFRGGCNGQQLLTRIVYGWQHVANKHAHWIAMQTTWTPGIPTRTNLQEWWCGRQADHDTPPRHVDAKDGHHHIVMLVRYADQVGCKDANVD